MCAPFPVMATYLTLTLYDTSAVIFSFEVLMIYVLQPLLCTW